jgi:polyhydroxyalkanoate synthesis repressor PhaR
VPIIKRYANRKLYNTASGCYITLEDIATLIRTGEMVHVLDHETGEDLTTQILAQVIFEREKHLKGLFPDVPLRRLIQAGEKALDGIKGSIIDTLNSDQVEREIERRCQSLVSKGLLSEVEGKRLSNLLLKERSSKNEPPIRTEEETIDFQTYKDLLSEVDRLEAELDKLSKSARGDKSRQTGE